MSSPFRGVRACVFDAYGTLFDVDAAARHCAAELGDRWEALSALWRTKQLEYTWLRSLMGRYADFRTVTADGLDFALAAHGIADTALRDRLLGLYDRLDAYPDAAATLDALRAAGQTTAILSNGSPAMLDSAVNHAGLRDRLDAVLSVDEVGVYKPHPSVYQLACDRLAVTKDEVLFVSANGWDGCGAAEFGFRVARLNRRGLPPERLPAQPLAEIAALAELPALL
ncbi:haloacid dehalogenase type II [Azospirillum sp. RWY-5-1]|uniref:(S)-2-haloacid dehalogenase n=1 Tax=Azospirillum oleiclasticum TaxID=2735135 RepID=A0ABX2T4L5_9PROT|nr:haloacid dehalogenase type II [Azospirillum oleiclasticum]NYZ11989.1 haloacid dehalogenase type II [Azospirillum oleiclasticum]NYZ19149.1 haloacid dehalogenase type II [Azospirillum oleiclasticum]